MPYGGHPYGGVGYAGADVAVIPSADTKPALAIEVSFTTDALAEPVWEDITADVRSWDVSRGRTRELERFQPGRATVVLGNLSRQYDSQHATGPHFGDLRPMRRMRIRETFNGVTYPTFDGYVDRWQLDYPGIGKDATATLTATDGFKILARTQLHRSVYFAEVTEDLPTVWWHAEEPEPLTTARNNGTLGATGDGTYLPLKRRGTPPLVIHDPGASIENAIPGGVNPVEGGIKVTQANFNLKNYGSWAIEFWTKPVLVSSTSPAQYVQGDAGASGGVVLVQVVTTGTFEFRVVNTVPTQFGVAGPTGGVTPNNIYHVVAKYGPNRALAIYINGTKYTNTIGALAKTVTGTLFDMDLGFLHTFEDMTAPQAFGGEFAVYTSAEAVDPLSDLRISTHNVEGTAPWSGDGPGSRIGRVLDEVGWPATLRDLDVGITSFQTATIGQTGLEHIQKCSESEYASLLFMSRAGAVRFVGRTAVLAREPYPLVFGDAAGEIGYRAFTPDDGDQVIRNRAVISRLGGVAKVAEDTASKAEFGRFDYVLEGLLHNSEATSQAYADFVVAEYKSPRRRITDLSLGPAIAGQEATVYPALLGRELGDAITVKSRPVGGGAVFTQTCAIEGIRHQSRPGGDRSCTWTLSPEYVTI